MKCLRYGLTYGLLGCAKLPVSAGWSAKYVIWVTVIRFAVMRNCGTFWPANSSLKTKNESGLLVMASFRHVGEAKSGSSTNSLVCGCHHTGINHASLCAHVKDTVMYFLGWYLTDTEGVGQETRVARRSVLHRTLLRQVRQCLAKFVLEGIDPGRPYRLLYTYKHQT